MLQQWASAISLAFRWWHQCVQIGVFFVEKETIDQKSENESNINQGWETYQDRTLNAIAQNINGLLYCNFSHCNLLSAWDLIVDTMFSSSPVLLVYWWCAVAFLPTPLCTYCMDWIFWCGGLFENIWNICRLRLFYRCAKRTLDNEFTYTHFKCYTRMNIVFSDTKNPVEVVAWF